MEWVPKVPEKRFFCHKCRGEIVFEVKMSRADQCPHCAADLHSCKNCQHWDPGAYNQCKEQIAEYIPDREAANRCTFFTFKSPEGGAPEDTESAADKSRAKLEALFKKKG
jgi:hypothetical protein